MAIEIDDDKLAEGVELVAIVPIVNPTLPPDAGPDQNTMSTSYTARGFVVAGGVNYNDDTVTIKTTEGETITVPVADADFATA